MTDYYFCKYSHKYTSELIYAFSQLKDIREKTTLNVLSIGCGPCTDLLALGYLKDTGNYGFINLDYRGVEINPSVWSNIYEDIFQMIPFGWSFAIIPEDICEYVNSLLEDDWKPDLIVLQYVLSDMQKHTDQQKIENMLEALAQYIDTCDVNTYVVCNDINLTKNQEGGREYFNTLYKKMCSHASTQEYHFNNINKPRHFEYGIEYNTSDLKVIPNNELDYYDPYMSCASAQMIIKREQ